MGVGNANSLGGGFARIFLAFIAPVTVAGTGSDYRNRLISTFSFYDDRSQAQAQTQAFSYRMVPSVITEVLRNQCERAEEVRGRQG